MRVEVHESGEGASEWRLSENGLVSESGSVSERGVRVESVRTYVFHMLGTYVTILCNWLIL